MPSKNKKYYKKLISEHKDILSKARKLIGVMLDKLDDEIQEFDNCQDENEKTLASKKFWWGDKESASSILTRLTTLLLKLIPLEQEIAKLDLTKADISELEEVIQKTKIPEEDLEIINRYVTRVRDEKS
jgi:hypothetical protein